MLDQNATYQVKGWPGIAFYVAGFPRAWEPFTCLVHDEDGIEIEVDSGEGEWIEQDESCGRVLVVMVGDDRKYEVDVSDLQVLAPDEYCASCGQMGCGWGHD